MWHIHLLADKVEGKGSRVIKVYFVNDQDDPPPVNTESIQEILYAGIRLAHKESNITFTELKTPLKRRETDQ